MNHYLCPGKVSLADGASEHDARAIVPPMLPQVVPCIILLIKGEAAVGEASEHQSTRLHVLLFVLILERSRALSALEHRLIEHLHHELVHVWHRLGIGALRTRGGSSILFSVKAGATRQLAALGTLLGVLGDKLACWADETRIDLASQNLVSPQFFC